MPKGIPTHLSVLLLSALFSSPAHAGTPGMTSSATVNSVFAREAATDIYTSSTSNPMACGNPDIFRIRASASNYGVLISTLLTAYAAHRPVTMWVDSCDTDGASVVIAVMAS